LIADAFGAGCGEGAVRCFWSSGYDGMMVRRYDGAMVQRYDGAAARRFDGAMVFINMLVNGGDGNTTTLYTICRATT